MIKLANLGRTRLAAAVVRRAVFGVGAVATFTAAIRKVKHSGRPDQGGAFHAAGAHPFDVAYGVETGGFQSWRELQSGRANDPYISGYLGIPPSIARRLFGIIHDCPAFTFVDLGCGKGRALIVASEFPFRRIIGVEIDAALAAQARRNAEVISASYPNRTRIDVLLGDAAAFAFPPDPLALFLYQPFERPVMRRVRQRLQDSLAARPREAVIIYAHPAHARVLDPVPTLERVATGTVQPDEEDRPFSFGGRGGPDGFAIWRTRAPAPALAPLS